MENHEQSSSFADLYLYIELVIHSMQHISWHFYVHEIKDLMEKYNDATLVDDLVARKTEAGLWVSNPDFPNNQDAPCSILFLLPVFMGTYTTINPLLASRKWTGRT